MSSQNPLFAVALDDATLASIHDASTAIAASPADLLGVLGLGYEPMDKDQLHMPFVFCTDRLCHLSASNLQALQSILKVKVAVEGVLTVHHFTFCGFELYAPDTSLLVARFKAPEHLLRLRKTVWRTCREYGVSYPDALWMPHVKLGKIRGTRAQIDSISCAGLDPWGPQRLVRPLGLTLLCGEKVQLTPSEWARALAFPEAAQDDDQPGAKLLD